MSIRRAAGALCLALPSLVILTVEYLQWGWVAVVASMAGAMLLIGLVVLGVRLLWGPGS